eukprot:PITA_21102
MDYHALKKITGKNHYPLPHIADLLYQLKCVVYFTKLDLRTGYCQVRIVKQDVWKTAFKTKQGLFEWMVMPFRPYNAPATFMQVVQWEGRQQNSFETLKEKISTVPVLALPDLQQPFEIETDANGYAMGVALMQQTKPICYHSKKFSQAVINYPTYEKELYALVQSVKKWKHYLISKETIIHTDHQPLQYL